jgi:hypothetical protein
VGEGRLTLAEGDERLAAIYATRFRDELRPLIFFAFSLVRHARWRSYARRYR